MLRKYISAILLLSLSWLFGAVTQDDLNLRDGGSVRFGDIPAKIVIFGGDTTPECKLAVSLDGNYFFLKKVNSTCTKLTNSKGVKIICNSDKSVCKTRQELVAFANGQTTRDSTTPSWCHSGRLNKTEKTICADSTLRTLDIELAKIYGSAKADTSDSGQMAWLKKRNQCKTDIACIRQAYEARITHLKKLDNVNEDRQNGYVTGLDTSGGDGFLAVRSGPSTRYEKLGELYNDDRVAILDRSGKWYRIQAKRNGLSGWVYGRYLHIENEQSRIVDEEKDLKETSNYNKIKARHILVSSKQEANMIIDMLRTASNNGTNLKNYFAKLAKKYSKGPSSEKGGDLGWFKKGVMIKSFEDAAFALQKGKFSLEPIKTQFGWHVIYLEDGVEALDYNRQLQKALEREDIYDVLQLFDKHRDALTKFDISNSHGKSLLEFLLDHYPVMTKDTEEIGMEDQMTINAFDYVLKYGKNIDEDVKKAFLKVLGGFNDTVSLSMQDQAYSNANILKKLLAYSQDMMNDEDYRNEVCNIYSRYGKYYSTSDFKIKVCVGSKKLGSEKKVRFVKKCIDTDEDIDYNSYGIAFVKIKDKYVMVKKNGCSKKEFDSVDPYISHYYSEDNFYIVKIGEKEGLIDSKGNTIIEPIYHSIYNDDDIDDPNDIKLIVGSDGDETIVFDRKGNIILRCSSFLEFSEGLAHCDDKGGFRILDKSGYISKKIDVDIVEKFSNGLAAFEKNGKWGFIDKTGNIVIENRFDEVKSFHGGLAAFEKNGKWGFIDKTGNIVIENRFDEVKSFHGGLAAFEKNGKWGFIDKTGKIIVQAKYLEVGYRIGLLWLLNDHAFAATERYLSIIDKDGSEIIKVKNSSFDYQMQHLCLKYARKYELNPIDCFH